MMTVQKCRSRVLMLMLCLAMLLPVGASATQAGGQISPRFSTVSTFKATLSINSSGYATCKGIIDMRTGYTAEVLLELQQKNGTNWETIKEWSDSGRWPDINDNRFVTAGYDYRLKLSADVYGAGGNLVESPVTYSSIVYY